MPEKAGRAPCRQQLSSHTVWTSSTAVSLGTEEIQPQTKSRGSSLVTAPLWCSASLCDKG